MRMSEGQEPSMVEKAAILLMSLPSEKASILLQQLGPKEVQKIGMAMASVKNVPNENVSLIVSDFLENTEKQNSLGMGADQQVRDILVGALGEEKASNILDKILLGSNTKGLDTLRWMDAKAVADLIRNEHPQIQCIVLSYLEPDQASEVLSYFTEVVRLDLILRISAQESVQPAALQELNVILEKQFSGTHGRQMATVGGVKAAADIMNFLDKNIEAELMENLKEKDEELAESIKELMFVFENLIDLDDRGIQALLREISTDVLILALKGADVALREKIFKNMSKRAAEMLRDDLEAKGPVKITEVETAQKEILSTAQKLAESGEISLGGKGGEEML